MMRASRQSGLTLLEMVVTIVIAGILAAVLASLLSGPMRGYVESGRRAQLTDQAETALLRMVREIRQALPNSVRIATSGSKTALEYLRTVSGGRYAAAPYCSPAPGCTPGGDFLDFTIADTGFDVIGSTLQVPAAGQWAVVYNLNATGGSANAYVGDNLATIGAGSTAAHVVLNPGFRFPYASPNQRFFVVDSPVSFVCDTATHTITRHQGYTITAAQSVAPGGSSALLVNEVTGCSITYDPGTATRAGMVTIELTLTDPTLNESVSLLQQAHVLNAP